VRRNENLLSFESNLRYEVFVSRGFGFIWNSCFLNQVFLVNSCKRFFLYFPFERALKCFPYEIEICMEIEWSLKSRMKWFCVWILTKSFGKWKMWCWALVHLCSQRGASQISVNQQKFVKLSWDVFFEQYSLRNENVSLFSFSLLP